MIWPSWKWDMATAVAAPLLVVLIAHAALWAIMALRGRCEDQCAYDKQWGLREATEAATRVGPAALP